MTKFDDGGPAFARPYSPSKSNVSPGLPGQRGMSLRDYFAAMAMQGFVAHGEYNVAVAQRAYQMADWMLQSREPDGEPEEDSE